MCKGRVNNCMDMFREAIAEVRTTISEYTVGKIGPVLILPLVILGIGGHIAIFVIGALHKADCSAIQMLPVYMALMGCTGVLKCLGLALQLGIAIQLSNREEAVKKKVVAASLMAESFIFDTGMNWLYTVILFIGVGTVLPSVGIDESLCNAVMFNAAFYPTVILFSLAVLLFLWILIKFIIEVCKTCCSKEEEVEDDMEPIQI